MSGKLYGVGVGPGDPELVTLKAHRIISGSPVIAYPAPDAGESFAREIVASYLTSEQVEIPIVIPMRAERFPAQKIYDEAAITVAEHLDGGRDVCVLCEGDPFFYGSFMYLYERLANKYSCEIIPGVSSLMASACAWGRPLAARNDVLSVVPAPLGDEEILGHFKQADAIALIKIGRHFNRIRSLIEQAGLLEFAGYLERVSLKNEKIIPLNQVDISAAPYFSVILIYKGGENWINAHGSRKHQEMMLCAR